MSDSNETAENNGSQEDLPKDSFDQNTKEEVLLPNRDPTLEPICYSVS